MTASLDDLACVTDDLAASLTSIVDAQNEDGLISWYPGGHGDPWNHVEAAMALVEFGCVQPAQRAYLWLVEHQRSDGAWHAYYAADGTVEEARIDTNATCNLAFGLAHYLERTGDLEFVEHCWPTVQRAIDFALGNRRVDGTISWSVGEGVPDFALLSACSSIAQSLRGAIALSSRFGAASPHWGESLVALTDCITCHPDRFADKSEYAMDWYYPVLAGLVLGEAGARRLADGWQRFVTAAGVRCRDDRPWITTAETAECAMAYLALGDVDRAESLLARVAHHRRSDGAYFTGLVQPEAVSFPTEECTTYSTAAVLLAHGALQRARARQSRTLTRTRRLPSAASRSSTNTPESIASR